MIYRIRRNSDGSEENYYPLRDRDGYYILATHKAPYPLNHNTNKVLVHDYGKMIELLKAGNHYLRMRGEVTGQMNIISADNIIGLDEAKIGGDSWK